MAAQLKDTQQDPILIDQCQSLAATLLSTHALRCYSTLLEEATRGAPERSTQHQARRLLAEVKHVLSLCAASYETRHVGRGFWRDLPNELKASGLLELWARGLLLAAAAEGGAGDAAALLWGTACPLRRIWDYMWSLETRNVFASPSLSYLLSSHLVGLCAALDGGTTYGMPAGPGAAAAPLFDANGRQLRPRAHVGPDLALMTLHMWTTWMEKARKALRKARSNAADAHSSCGGSGGGNAAPPARQAPMHSLQQALRACLQQCEQRSAALRNAAQGAGEAAGASGAQRSPLPQPPSGSPQPAEPAPQQPEGVAAARAPVEGGEEEPAASPQDGSSTREEHSTSGSEGSQPQPCDTLAERSRRCEKDAARMRELLSGAPLPPLNAAAAFDISMRLATSCVCALQRAAAATAAPAVGAPDGAMRPAAAAEPSVQGLDAGPQQQQQQQEARPLLRAADALPLAARALGCAHAICAEVSELPYSRARARPRAMQRLRRVWATQLTLGTAADGAGLLADAYTFWHVAGFQGHDSEYDEHPSACGRPRNRRRRRRR